MPGNAEIAPGIVVAPPPPRTETGQEQNPPSKHRTIAVQTVYRDSEAQTSTWSPDYVVDPDDEDNELLDIAHMEFEPDKPPSLEQINEIWKLRQRKQLNKAIEALAGDDPERMVLIQAREQQLAQERKQAFAADTDDKMRVFIETLKEREDMATQMAQAKVDRVRWATEREADKLARDIERERVKNERALLRTRAALGPPLAFGTQRKDIIAEHTNFASKVYAPTARDGHVPVHNKTVDYELQSLKNFQGIAGLEKTLPAALVRPSSGTSKSGTRLPQLSARKSKKDMQLTADLALLAGEIPTAKSAKKSLPPVENMYKKFQAVVRPPTPEVPPPDRGTEELAAAVTLLQRLLKGRAVQNAMFQGKQQNIQLIKELALDDAEQHADLLQSEQTAQAASARSGASASASAAAVGPFVESTTDAIDEALDAIQGDVISGVLDFLAKERVRVAEEIQIANMVKLAVRTRRVREAEEAGRRQAEDIMRAKRQQYQSELMREHDASAGRLLDELFPAALDVISTRQAQIDASLHGNFIGGLLDIVEDKQDDSECIIDDLLTEFVLPEVNRHLVRKADDLEQRRFVFASHNALQTALAQVAALTLPPEPQS